MTDDYAELRAALAAGPAIGPYIVDQDNGNGIVVVDGRGYIVAEANYGDVPSECGPGVTETIIRDVRSTHLYIAAANPEVIRALLDERDALAKDAARYAIARRMSPQQWADAWELNHRTGKPFDEIIDDLAPFFDAEMAGREG